MTVDRGGTALSVETLFEVLASPYRRFILTHLASHDDGSVDDLAHHVVAWETDRTGADETDEAYRRAQNVLYHIHLPKLANVGLIEYDREHETVTRGESFDAAEPYLDFTERLKRS
jgi:predicted transcriptional regulator